MTTIGQATSPAAPLQATESTQSLSQLGEDYTRFLTLLTAQVSNQDPLSPMDSTQFVAQLAQMSQVEQAVRTNSQLEALRNDLSLLSIATGSQMVGHGVSVASNEAVLEDGTTDTYYRLATPAATVTAEISDPLGRVIRTIRGLPGSADTDIPIGWDGRDDDANPVLEGRYGVSIKALDSSGNPLPAQVFRDAEIREVMFREGQMYFDVGNGEVLEASSLLAIR